MPGTDSSAASQVRGLPNLVPMALGFKELIRLPPTCVCLSSSNLATARECNIQLVAHGDVNLWQTRITHIRLLLTHGSVCQRPHRGTFGPKFGFGFQRTEDCLNASCHRLGQPPRQTKAEACDDHTVAVTKALHLNRQGGGPVAVWESHSLSLTHMIIHTHICIATIGVVDLLPPNTHV